MLIDKKIRTIAGQGISPHPASHALYIATGGSFHSWEFLPNIGKYTTKMIDGKLEPALAKKWAWDREDEGGVMDVYFPHRDLKDVEDFKE